MWTYFNWLVIEFMDKLLLGSGQLYQLGDNDWNRVVMFFFQNHAKEVWDHKNAVIHNEQRLQIERLNWKIEVDMSKEEV